MSKFEFKNCLQYYHEFLPWIFHNFWIYLLEILISSLRNEIKIMRLLLDLETLVKILVVFYDLLQNGISEDFLIFL